jgi:prepilin-type N-terminal cleavage/methylation domain-containing protein
VDKKVKTFKSDRGLTLIELLISITIMSLISVVFAQLLGGALDSWRDSKSRGDLLSSARIAMERMVSKARDTSWVLLPLKVSDPTDPGYPASSYYPRDILAVSGNIDNDGDGLTDEDPGTDITADGASGIMGIDDNNDSVIDGEHIYDDDEDGFYEEDELDENGEDADLDGRFDEDPDSDFFQDGNDDDDDGLDDEDPFDPLIYYLNGTTLMERQNVLNATTADNAIAENVSEFSVIRRRVNGNTLIDIYLKLDDGEESVELRTTVLARSMFRLPGN